MSDDSQKLPSIAKKTFQSMPKPVPTRELDSVDRERIELNRRDTAALDPANRPENVAFAATAELEAIPDIPAVALPDDEDVEIKSGGTFEGVPLPWRNSGSFRVAEDPEGFANTERPSSAGELGPSSAELASGAAEPTSVGALPWRESGRYRSPERERVAEPPENANFPPPPLPEYDQRQYADTLQNPEQQPSKAQKNELNDLLRAYLNGDKLSK